MKLNIESANTHSNVAKNQHLLPRTYMKQWSKDNTDSVYFFDKTHFEEGVCQRKVDTINSLNNYYDIKAGDLFVPDDALNEIFGFLNELDIDYIDIEEDGIEGNIYSLSTLKELNAHYRKFENWIIKDKNGNLATKKERNKIKQRLEQARYTFIEEEWNKQYENNWIPFITSFEKNVRDTQLKVFSKVPKLKIDDFFQLMEYIVIFDFRNFNGNSLINELLDTIIPNEAKEIVVPNKEKVHYFNNTAYEEFKYGDKIEAYYEYLKLKKGHISVMLKNYINKLDVIIYITDFSNPFITSDKPSMVIKNTSNKNEHIFVATPTMLITTYLRNGKVPNYSVKKIDVKGVKYYNKRIAEYSNSLIVYDPKQINSLM